ncbi:hypothetical protein D3C73_1478520 [compost metagenome]
MIEQGNDAAYGRAPGGASRLTGELLYGLHQMLLVAPALGQNQGLLFDAKTMNVILSQAEMRGHMLV